MVSKKKSRMSDEKIIERANLVAESKQKSYG